MSARSQCGRRFAIVAVLSVCTGLLAPAAERAAGVEPTEIVLPPFIIDGTDAPPWLYARMRETEVLSRCTSELTAGVLVSYGRAQGRLELLLPVRLQGRTEHPELLILEDESLWKRSGRSADGALVTSLDGRTVHESDAVRMTFPPNVRLSDADLWATFVVAGGQQADIHVNLFTAQAVAQLMAARVPRLPGWFTAGFLSLYPRVHFRENVYRFLRMQSLQDVIVGKPRDGAGGRRLALSLASVLQMGSGANPGDPHIRMTIAELFVRWGLDPAAGRAASFHRLVEQAAQGQAAEAAIQECLGMTMDEVEAALIAYAVRADRDGAWSEEAASLDAARPYPIRKATRSEIARVKGEWERLEARYVAWASPDRLADYVGRARRTLEHADEDDAGLAGSLGLLELEFGSRDRAREFLESAAGAGSRRTRVHFELAKLRLDECLATSKRNDGRLDFDATRSVLQPLETSARLEPRLVQVYQLMANVWDNSASRPSLADLGFIADGVRLFPQDVELLYQAALAYRQGGDAQRSRQLAEQGWALEGDRDDSRFAALLLPSPGDGR